MRIKLRIFLITEGGGSIGFGHITRCASLYQAFEEKGKPPELIVNGDEAAKELLTDKRCRIFNWLDNSVRLISSMKDADIAIVDSYIADYSFYEKVSRAAKTSIYIDDNKRVDYPKGIVINGGVYAEKINYPKKADITYLLGSQYIPLRKAFWKVPDKEIKGHIESIMITFGGDDAKNMTPKVLKLLVDNYPKLTKNVIIGKGFLNISDLERIKDNNTNLLYYPDAEGMKKIMLESDIAISAGGQTLCELANVGIPTIAIAVAENQMNNVRGWENAGFIKYAGWWEDGAMLQNIEINLELLRDKILREEMSKAGRFFVDGQGARRVVQEIIYGFEKEF